MRPIVKDSMAGAFHSPHEWIELDFDESTFGKIKGIRRFSSLEKSNDANR